MPWQTTLGDEGIPPGRRDWITTTQRMAQTLKSVFPAYGFQKLGQSWRELTADETDILGESGRAWVRSVVHQNAGETVVEGFSIVPERTFSVLDAALEGLESKPIGDTLLFGNPAVMRGEFFFQPHEGCWQRGSVFTYVQAGQSYPLLVVERFVDWAALPAYPDIPREEEVTSCL